MNGLKFCCKLSLGLMLAISPVMVAQSAPALPDISTAGVMGEEIFRNSGSTGMVMVVVRDKEVYFHGYGETAPGSHQTPTLDSVVRLCSLTKIFTTDLLSKLAADRTVHLDDTLQKFAPEGVTVPRREESIRLVDLATHTAGLPRELGNPGRGTPHFTYPDYATRWRWLPNQKLRSVPGTQALYSNVGFDLLGDALQAAAKTPYPRLLAERTLDPLHMPNTTYFPTTQQCALLLAGVHDQGPCTVTEQTAGSSGLYSTAADMTIWLKYLLGTAEPAIPAQSEAAQDVYLAPEKLTRQIGLDHAGKPTGVGLGWIHVQPLDDPSHLVQKTGGGAGFTTYIAINPARKTAVFLARTEGLDSWKQNLFLAANDLVLQMAGLPPLPPPPPRAVVKKRVVKKPGKSVPVKKKAAPAGRGKRKAR